MISKRAQHIKPFIAMEVMEAAQKLERAGKDIVHFSIGEPDFPPPPCVEEACIQAIRDGYTKYTHSQGLVELREAIAEDYFKKYHVSINPDQVIVTQGSSPAFFLIFSTLLEQGDEVIMPNPHYPCDKNFIDFLGGHSRFLEIYEKEDYQWNTESLKKLIDKKTRGIFVTSPSNPTGTVLQKEILKQIANLSIPIISDEIYHGLVYEGKAHSMLEFTDNAFVVNGFSKSYSMTGFRLGYVIAPQKYIRPMQIIQQNFAISTNAFVQRAGIAAIKHAQNDVLRMKEEFMKRRDVMLGGLKELGFKVNYIPQGAFYIFVNTKHLGESSYDLAFDILNKAHVAVTPGIDFGSAGEQHLRFSYAVSVEKIQEGIARLKKYLALT